MKINVTNKFKLWIIITLVVVVAGMVMLGVFGLNTAVDYRNGYEIKVSVDQDAEGSAANLKKYTEEYFSQKGVKTISCATQNSPEGTMFIYKINDKPEFTGAELTTYLNDKLNTPKAVAEAFVSEVVTYGAPQVWQTAVPLAIAAVVLTLYIMIFEKPASALATLIASVIATGLFVAVVSLARIPAYPFFGTATALTFVLAFVLAAVTCNRFKEESKKPSNAGATFNELADLAAGASLIRYVFTGLSLLLVSLLLGVLKIGYPSFVGLLLVAADVCAVFAAFVWTPVLWAALRKANVK